jgi:hypothetical protein
MAAFNGLGTTLGNLSWLADARTRSLSAENPTGAKGNGARATDGISAACARDLGPGWKINPCVAIAAGQTAEIADIEGPGAVQHMWMTPTAPWRALVLRVYWDGQASPSIECPLGDFFACGWGTAAGGGSSGFVNSLAVCVNPGSALNCYWEMPFRRRCRMTVENIGFQAANLFYQIDYALADVPEHCAYLHAQFRRVNPLPYKSVYTIIDGVRGRGHYVGTYLAWGVNNGGWWGEGEIKFYLDGDGEHPTICGTGTEDYFCGSYNFEADGATGKRYQEFSTAYAGLSQVVRPDGLYRSQQRFGMYRWHIPDPIRFAADLRVTIQALGWRAGGRYLPLQDDIASVAFWYQALPAAPFPALPGRDELEIV